MTIDVTFIDSGREPTEKPDPKYPEGQHVNLTEHALQPSCCRNVPYPAPRCGQYVVHCRGCGYRAIVTVAGRADDPRTVQIPCKKKPH